MVRHSTTEPSLHAAFAHDVLQANGGGNEDSDPLTAQKQREKSHRKKVMYLTNTLAVVAYFVVGVIFYCNFENWTVFDSFYFTIVTISTVGYGDESPTNDNSRLFTIFYLLVGIYIIFNAIYFMANRSVKRVRNALLRSTLHQHDHRKGQEQGRRTSLADVGRTVSNAAVNLLIPPSVRDSVLPSQPSIDAEIDPRVIEDKHEKKDSEKQTPATLHDDHHAHHHVDDHSPFNEGVQRFDGGRKVYIHRKQRMVISIVTLIVMVFIGAIFLWCNEDFSFITALFLAVQTSTVSS